MEILLESVGWKIGFLVVLSLEVVVGSAGADFRALSRCAARDPGVSVTSRSQSDRPVEMRI